MENSATLNAPQNTNQNTTQSAASQPKAPAAENKTKVETKQYAAPKRTMMELLREMNEAGGDYELWYLTYMLHAPEVVKFKKMESEKTVSVNANLLCNMCASGSSLEYLARCTAELKNDSFFYKNTWIFSTDLKAKCPNCAEKVAFCPHKMAAYIQLVCQENQLDVEQLYKLKLAEHFVKKPEFAKFRKLDIPKESYDFLDAVSVAAAAQLLKLKLCHSLSVGERYMRYSYLPMCEIGQKSWLDPIMCYYRCKDGKQDMLRLDGAKQDLGQNRNCTGCIFPQCPDKVAAYLLYLSDKFAVDVMELAEFVAISNKIGGVTLRGNFRYYYNLRQLDDIPFTAESRQTINNIARYVINKYSVGKGKVPFLPINMLIYTRDEQLADDAQKILRDFMYYYTYMNLEKTVVYKFSEGGLEGLIKTIKAQTKPTPIYVKEMGLLANETDTRETTLLMTQLTNLMEEKRDLIWLVVTGEKKKLDAALGSFNDFYQGTLCYQLTVSDMTTTRVLHAVIEELKKTYVLEEGFENALEYYVLAKYGESPLKSKAFIRNLVQAIQFNHYNKELNAENMLLVQDIPATTARRSDEEIWSELNNLTGLENVKDEIRTIDQLLKFQRKLQNLGNKSIARPNMHMVFAGNPGTGKTTVARLMAEIFYNVGFIKQNKLIEVSAKDLIGKYIGHTAPQTAAVCESAYGGVLFIDEAYELTASGDSNNAVVRGECIAELIKQMEDNRDRLIVIFAGYTKEMEKLLDSNPGFASRVGRIIQFRDYSEDQLVDMFIQLVRRNGMGITQEAIQTARLNITVAGAQPHFGNGRYVRNLFEKTMMEHAKNMVAVDDAELLTQIMENDIPLI